MTKVQMIAALRNMGIATTDTDAVLSTYLDLAGEKINNKCYPFQPYKHEVPAKYHHLQVEIACYLLNKRGAEGETAHNENGIQRSYEAASIPESMLKDVVPFVGTFFGKAGV